MAAWYIARGYEIIDRNWRCREGELDVVARRDGTVVFCEVKARSGDRFGTAAEAVTARKQARLRRAAGRWLAEAAPGLGIRRVPVRFDVATVVSGRLDVIEEAF